MLGPVEFDAGGQTLAFGQQPGRVPPDMQVVKAGHYEGVRIALASDSYGILTQMPAAGQNGVAA